MKYREKVHEIDSMRLKLDQAAEFKIKIMESQASLKKELEQVKREKQDVVEANDDMSDMADALEMATLDKEMAEEKVSRVGEVRSWNTNDVSNKMHSRHTG